MDFEYSETQQTIRAAVRKLCDSFGVAYWRGCDERGAYPEDFVEAMTAAGWLGALIPEAYGGSGLGLMEGCVILEEVNRSGGNGAASGEVVTDSGVGERSAPSAMRIVLFGGMRDEG